MEAEKDYIKMLNMQEKHEANEMYLKEKPVRLKMIFLAYNFFPQCLLFSQVLSETFNVSDFPNPGNPDVAKIDSIRETVVKLLFKIT